MTFDNVAILRVGEFHPLVQELLAERPQLFFGTFECQLNTSNCLLRLIGSHIARQNANYCHVIGPMQICPRAVTCTVCAVPLAQPFRSCGMLRRKRHAAPDPVRMQL